MTTTIVLNGLKVIIAGNGHRVVLGTADCVDLFDSTNLACVLTTNYHCKIAYLILDVLDNILVRQ